MGNKLIKATCMWHWLRLPHSYIRFLQIKKEKYISILNEIILNIIIENHNHINKLACSTRQYKAMIKAIISLHSQEDHPTLVKGELFLYLEIHQWMWYLWVFHSSTDNLWCTLIKRSYSVPTLKVLLLLLWVCVVLYSQAWNQSDSAVIPLKYQTFWETMCFRF